MADDQAGSVSFDSPMREKQALAHDGSLGFGPDGIVRRIREGDEKAVQELHRMFDRGVRFLISRKLGTNAAETVLLDTFREFVRAISEGDISDSDAIAPHIHAAMQRVIDASLAKKDHAPETEGVPRPGPTGAPQRACDYSRLANVSDEAVARTVRSASAFETADDYESAEIERRRAMLNFLASLPARDREALIRFYVHRQPAEQICGEMGLSEAELRHLRSSARAGFAGSRTAPAASRPCGTLGRISVGRIVRPQKRSTA